MMTAFQKSATAALTALALSGAVLTTSSQAEARPRHYYGGAIAAGVVGGLALGALAASAAASPAYAEPVYPYPAYAEAPTCYKVRRTVWVEGLGWRSRRVTVCE